MEKSTTFMIHQRSEIIGQNCCPQNWRNRQADTENHNFSEQKPTKGNLHRNQHQSRTTKLKLMNYWRLWVDKSEN